MQTQTQIFAVTKIQPPRLRTSFIARADLELRLRQAALSKRLVLVIAPAGFGKTVALTRLVRSAPSDNSRSALAWVAADKDDDLHRFLACLCAALEPFDLPWRTDPDALIASASRGRAELRDAATALLNALSVCEVERGCIVLDDMHRIADPAVFEFLDLLLERLPERWCLLVSSRTEPPLALSRLRVADELAEFRLADLQFSSTETQALVQAAPAASMVDAEQLRERTQGWPAGLSMMLRTAGSGVAGANPPGERSIGRRSTDVLRSTTATVMDRHMFDYLASEVLDEMPGALREFLLRCSVLPELTAARCASVSGNSQAAVLLEEIDRRALFVTVLDGVERTLRLHDLFRDFLEDRLMREHPGDVQQVLMRAASNEPDTVRRVGYLIRAGAWEAAASALGEFGTPLIAAGAVDPVLRLIEQFPPQMREHSAALALIRGLCGWARWDWPAMTEAMQRAKASFARAADREGEQLAMVYEAVALNGLGRLEQSRALLADLNEPELPLKTLVLSRIVRSSHAPSQTQIEVPAANYDAAMDAVEGSNDLQLWYQCPPRLLYICLPGMHAPLQRFVDGAVRHTSDSPSPLRGMANSIGAWLAVRSGRVDVAVERMAIAADDERWLARLTNLHMYVNYVSALICVAQGRTEEGLRAAQQTFVYFDSPTLPRDDRMTSALGHYVFHALRVAHALGDADAVRTLARRLPSSAPPDESVLNEQRRTLPARLADIDGDPQRAVEAWMAALEHERTIDVMGQANEARMRCAHSLLLLGRKADAARMLGPVFERVDPGDAADADFTGPLMAGAVTREVLASAAWGSLLDAAQVAQLQDWSRRFASAPQVEHRPADEPREPVSREVAGLSSREHEVLQRIAAGDSNKLIARAFELSPHTVKRHVANILDKLALQSRGQAAAWYRAHDSA